MYERKETPFVHRKKLSNKKKHGCYFSNTTFAWINVRLSLSKEIYFICFNGSPLILTKIAFYFILKAHFAFKICKFLSCSLVMQKNNLVRKKKLISKFMTLSLGKKPIPLHILTNISRIKGNQTMKYGQLIEYNMRNIFLEKSYTKSVGETISRPFSKKLKLSISLNQ